MRIFLLLLLPTFGHCQLLTYDHRLFSENWKIDGKPVSIISVQKHLARYSPAALPEFFKMKESHRRALGWSLAGATGTAATVLAGKRGIYIAPVAIGGTIGALIHTVRGNRHRRNVQRIYKGIVF